VKYGSVSKLSADSFAFRNSIRFRAGINVKSSASHRATPPRAGVKVKPCGCCTTLTPLAVVARLNLPAPRESPSCPTKGYRLRPFLRWPGPMANRESLFRPFNMLEDDVPLFHFGLVHTGLFAPIRVVSYTERSPPLSDGGGIISCLRLCNQLMQGDQRVVSETWNIHCLLQMLRPDQLLINSS
jgi:hypothetical protein